MTMPEPRHDQCPVCLHLLPGPGVLIICDICGTITFPDPTQPPMTPPDTPSAWLWTGERWMYLLYEGLP